ncbi:ClpP/crotonase [Thelephora ganbajun]|uniref:ClpP/crotonase n=1 Tax=Thelephora ganbajun TaxID=370292 RepID=A0ACB6Z5M6_THEGA|nr:ClpP/crotonase [Thelephora ganbajun]
MSHLGGKYFQVSVPTPHVYLIQVNRAPVNAFNESVWREYSKVFEKISLEDDVRVIVLASGLDKLFTAGLDCKSAPYFVLCHGVDRTGIVVNSGLSAIPASPVDAARAALHVGHHIKEFQHAIAAPERCPFPVIVAIHGLALGLAIDMITACDVRFAASNASFSIKEADIGLAADIGTLARLPKLTGNQSLVHELAYSTRPFSAAEAKELGLVSKVVEGGRQEVLNVALELAKNIAEKSPVAVVGTKRLLLHARDNTVAGNLEYTVAWNAGMLQTAVSHPRLPMVEPVDLFLDQDIPEAVGAVMKKRKPAFKSLNVQTGIKADAKL